MEEGLVLFWQAPATGVISGLSGNGGALSDSAGVCS